MIKTREYYGLLIKGRKNLSLIILLSKVCISLTWVGGFFGLIVLVFKWVGGTVDIAFLPFDFLGLWLILTIVSAGVLGFVLARKEGMDFHKTAEWLDQNLNLQEILSSAYLCLERNCSGAFDERLVKEAEACAAGIQSHPEQVIKWPVRKVKQQMQLAFLTILIITSLLAWWHPQKKDSISLQNLTLKEEIIEIWEESTQSSELLMNYSLQEVTDVLFSDDQALAEAAEQALATGDAAAFHRALEQAAANNDLDLPAETPSALFEALRQTQTGSYQGENSPEDTGGPSRTGLDTDTGALQGKEGDGQGDSSGSRGGEQERASKGAGGEEGEVEEEQRDALQQQAPSDTATSDGMRREDPDVENSTSPLHESSSAENDGRDDMISSSFPTQSLPGKGSGKEETDWGDPDAKLKEQALIKEQEDGGFLEYLLPGSDSTVPLFEFIPHIQQATETALERQVISLEYEEFVRDYYLQLYKEISPTVESE